MWYVNGTKNKTIYFKEPSVQLSEATKGYQIVYFSICKKYSFRDYVISEKYLDRAIKNRRLRTELTDILYGEESEIY